MVGVFFIHWTMTNSKSNGKKSGIAFLILTQTGYKYRFFSIHLTGLF